MNLSKLTSRFRKASDVSPPSAAPIDIIAPPANGAEQAKPVAPADKTVATSPPVDAQAPAAASVEKATPAEPVMGPSRSSRLVEGERPKSSAATAAVQAKAALDQGIRKAKRHRKPLAAAAALTLSAGLGYAGGTIAGNRSETRTQAAVLASVGEATADLRQSQGEIGRLSAELKAVRASIDAAKGERSRGDGAAKQAQLIEKLDRAGQDNAARIGRLSEQLDRVEKGQREPARLQAMVERLDRLEKAVPVAAAPASPAAPPSVVAAVSVPTPPAKPPLADVVQTGSLGDAKPAKPDLAKPDLAKAEPAKADPDPRRTQLEGFVVRDVDDGYALIETRSGRFLEVAAGQTLAGVGRVEAVERRGRQWVVVTPRGFIGERWN